MLPSTCRLYTNYDREWMSHWRTLFQYISVKKSVGKPEFSNKLLKDKFIARPLEHIVWCYAKHQQDLFEELIKMNVEYVESIPRELGKYFKKKKRNLIMLDDLMDEVLKVLNCLHVVVMTTFPLSILRRICSIKMNVLLVWIPITWLFLRNPKTIHNLLLQYKLLLQDQYSRIKWSSLCGLTKTQYHLGITTWCLIWNQTLP